jgi:hypothetical protein
MNTLYAVGVGGCILSLVNAILWLAQLASERRWKFIGSETRKLCLQRMWLNLWLALVFAVAGAAGWWM